MRRTAAVLLLSTATCLGAASAAPALASAPGAGQPYGCTINPKAAGCQKTANTTSSQPPALPTTGGAAGLSGSNDLLPLAGVGLALFGFALRRRAR